MWVGFDLLGERAILLPGHLHLHERDVAIFFMIHGELDAAMQPVDRGVLGTACFDCGWQSAVTMAVCSISSVNISARTADIGDPMDCSKKFFLHRKFDKETQNLRRS